MVHRVKTSFFHRLVTSPIGISMETKWYEKLKMQSLHWEFTMARIAAAARVTSVGSDGSNGSVDDFLRELGLALDAAPRLRQRIGKALQAYGMVDKAFTDICQRWETIFWSTKRADYSDEERVFLEQIRRENAAQWVRPTHIFGFLGRNELIPAARFEIPTPATVFSEYAAALTNPHLLYEAPHELPEPEISQAIPGPAGKEYWLRFATPSSFLRDIVYARVYEPEHVLHGLPTLIYASGLGMAYDQCAYWPEEEYLGRSLAALGYRVVLIESPWHGRRTPLGSYSGERCLAKAPASFIELYSAQVREIAILTHWARALGASTVTVGGLSLGGIVAQQVASWCGTWPKSLRPDTVIMVANCGQASSGLLGSDIAAELGVDGAMRRAGWNEKFLEGLHPLLDPKPKPGLDPSRIFAMLGEQDRATPYRFAAQMLDDWNVPQANRLIWKTGHFGVFVRMIRRPEVRQFMTCAMNKETKPSLQLVKQHPTTVKA
jgi:pimeloyl-ACP methyl ester carboxylesterase